jgi:AraC-like DNA-binding protein/mannose-6-phosphate isomerase-like protein (cupin superfamily)
VIQPRASRKDRPLPSLTTGRVTEDEMPVLLWVHTGATTIEAAGVDYVLTAGEALWVPPGVEHDTRTHPGGVVLPVFPSGSALPGAPTHVKVVAVPDDWADWLVSQFDFNRYHTCEEGGGDRDLLALVVGGSSTSGGSRTTVVPPLTMPSSAQARAVADELRRSPASLSSAVDLAAHENISVRTLQRQFKDETGLSLSEWRTRARVTLAASMLATGRGVGIVAHDVGFETPGGFTRAFRRHVGVAPKDYVHSNAGAIAAATSVEAPTLDREPPTIPARQVWSWVFDWHVLWWVYRGEVSIRIGIREVLLRRGQAVWIPAGFSASVDERGEGSILLPLGNRSGHAEIGSADLQVADLAGLEVASLLHTVLVEYTLFKRVDDDGPDHGSLTDVLFHEQFDRGAAYGPDAGLSGVVGIIARSLRREPSDSRSLAAWAAEVGEPSRRLGRKFLEQTGRDFPRWRADLRMSLARELLRDGATPRAAARTLGYATQAGFGQVFTTTHGLTPRQYQLRVMPRRVAPSA